MNLLTVNNLSAGYNGKLIIKDINFSLPAGQIAGILGANGCGKTTLIKAIANLIPHQGNCVLGCLPNINMEDMSAKALSRLCGYIPQRSGISIDLTLFDVVMMSFNPDLRLLQPPSEQMKRAALDALASVGLEHRRDDNYMQLSEGQKQLCLLARTFAGNRQLLLLDEPESALDFRLRYKTMELLREYVNRNQSSAMVTLHDSSLALNYCDTLLVLGDSQVLGEIHPNTTPLPEMERLLSRIYGTISLTELKDKQGNKRLVMLKDA